MDNKDNKENKDNKNKKDNLHKGHRQRMWKKYSEYGLDIFNEHEILEMLLYMCIPRSNTNDTAHKLIERFGSLKEVLNAPRGELVKVDNIGDNSALLISFINDIIRYINARSLKPVVFKNSDTIIDHCMNYFCDNDTESLAVFLVDKNMCVFKTLDYRLGRQGSDVNFNDIVSGVMKSNCKSIVLAHNHPDGGAYSSNNDLIFTRHMYTLMNSISVELIDHIVIQGGNGYSIRNSGEVSDIWI